MIVKVLSRTCRKLCTNPIKRKTPAKKVVKIDNAKKRSTLESEEEKKCFDKACKRFKAGSMQRAGSRSRIILIRSWG